MYNNTECAVAIDGNITDWFQVHIVVRQGCLLSPTLFNIFLEFVMADVKSIEKTLILSDKMSADIRYADDTTLISAMFEKLQLSTLELEAACKKWGMKINSSKTKLITTVHNDEIIIDGNTVEKNR